MELYWVKAEPDTLESQNPIPAPKELDKSKYHALKQMVQAVSDVDGKNEHLPPLRERFEH